MKNRLVGIFFGNENDPDYIGVLNAKDVEIKGNTVILKVDDETQLGIPNPIDVTLSNPTKYQMTKAPVGAVYSQFRGRN